MLRATFSRVIKFWLQPIMHETLFNKSQSKGNAVTKGLAGAAATIPEVLTISPFENLKLAAQLDKEGKFKGMADTASHLVKTRGIGGLYICYAGMQMRQALWTGGFFMSLDVMKAGVQPICGNGALCDGVAGFGAGVFGTVLNCWTDVTRTVIQKETVADTFDPSKPRTSILREFNPAVTVMKAQSIMAERGFAGLYAGFAVKSVYLGGSGAILAVLVPRFKELWGCS